MMRIPELAHAAVRHSGQCASGGSPQVGQQNRFPYDEHLDFPLWMLCEKLFSCGGPPQTKRSCWRKQQNQARPIGIRIKRGFERV